MTEFEPCRQTVQALRRLFGHFPHVTQVTRRLESIIDYGVHPFEEAENLMILGLSGCGKSTLLQRFVRKYSITEHEEYTEIPVLYVRVDAKCSIKTLAGTMLKALGSEFWNKGKEEERTYQLVTLLKACKVRLVILDEINHLVDRGGEKTHHSVADWIKRLTDEVRIPFVLAGIPRSERLLETNDQLRSRFREVIEIVPFSIADDESEKTFRDVLKTFSDKITGIDSVDLTCSEMAGSLAFATGGRLREICKLLVRAVELAYEQKDKPKLTIKVLSEAFSQVIYRNAPNNRNPFHSKFNGIPLTGAGEPFSPVER